MSDLRLEDLVVPNPNIEGDYYPVTRAEVLMALEAQREWACWWDWTCHTDETKRKHRLHSSCGYVWVVSDAT